MQAGSHGAEQTCSPRSESEASCSERDFSAMSVYSRRRFPIDSRTAVSCSPSRAQRSACTACALRVAFVTASVLDASVVTAAECSSLSNSCSSASVPPVIALSDEAEVVLLDERIWFRTEHRL